MGKLKLIYNSAYLQKTNPILARQLECLDYVEKTIERLILRILEEQAGTNISSERLQVITQKKLNSTGLTARK